MDIVKRNRTAWINYRDIPKSLRYRNPIELIFLTSKVTLVLYIKMLYLYREMLGHIQ